MPTFRVSASWRMFGDVTVEANSAGEAINKVEDNENDEYPTCAFDGEYIDDSFKVESCEEV